MSKKSNSDFKTRSRMPTLVTVDGEIIGQLTRKNRVIKVKENSRLRSGREVLDPVSSVVSIEFRPPTLMDQIDALTRLGRIRRTVPDDEFMDDDDFHDHLDDIPPGGESPYELGIHDGSPWSIRKAAFKAREARVKAQEAAKKRSATPPADSSLKEPPAPPKGQAEGSPTPDSE